MCSRWKKKVCVSTIFCKDIFIKCQNNQCSGKYQISWKQNNCTNKIPINAHLNVKYIGWASLKSHYYVYLCQDKLLKRKNKFNLKKNTVKCRSNPAIHVNLQFLRQIKLIH